ncbi:anthranilate synthase component II [Pelagicoccus albus]|uniref:Aminodeoxychorismate/anthranilate synthase component II n=1 Tax=Pelagicoccus albus TaxID=415222 RepID=A0A7X1E8L3_9BACT|nr:aminodeoxychorismate/anthranilate synthase component II [Pelagicoccus albus]MBC2606905.1 aminodeoxychorismate/anthranilate synthase component II [Pelagicoccus albus]
MILLIDNYDSFTYNLSQYLRELGEKVTVVRNDEIDSAGVAGMNPRLIVISPGPGGPGDAGNCKHLLDTFHAEIPFLGICLGMQTIAEFFGARIIIAKEPVHGKVRRINHNSNSVFSGLPNPLQVTRYHSLVVERESLPECLEISAESEEGEIMGIRHSLYPISGVQFHPEAYLTEGGHALLKNALNPSR